MEEIYRIENSADFMRIVELEPSAYSIEDDRVDALKVPGSERLYIPWGSGNCQPYNIMKLIADDEVMSQNKLFNALTCYGAGVSYLDKKTKEESEDPEVENFISNNNIPYFFMDQCTDMKYFYFAVALIKLSRDGSVINHVRHLEACHCRFEKANKRGQIEHLFYADWSDQPSAENIRTIPLLDIISPYTDLKSRMSANNGFPKTKEREFAVLEKFPMPNNMYYPRPYYLATFRGDWYDIKRLISRTKKARLKNGSSIKYQVEISSDYWQRICDQEGIINPKERLERVMREKDNIRQFVSGIDNQNKIWFTSFYVDPGTGKAVSDVRIINLENAGKEGGDWSDDIQESTNFICYADGIHPNMVGAVPGKSQSNNSGSDKRELFTMKQAIEKPFKDVLMTVHKLIIKYNGWNLKPDVPMVLLTTLDQNTDAKEVSNAKTK